MKWYNKEKTKMIDLKSINGFVYISAKNIISKIDYQTDTIEPEILDFKENGDKLEIIIGGSVFVFRGDTAIEIYNLLLSFDALTLESQEKQVLKG